MSRPRRRSDERVHYGLLLLVFLTSMLCGYTLYTVNTIRAAASAALHYLEEPPAPAHRGPLTESCAPDPRRRELLRRFSGIIKHADIVAR